MRDITAAIRDLAGGHGLAEFALAATTANAAAARSEPPRVPDAPRHGVAAGVGGASPKILLINLVAVEGASWVKISS